MRVAKVAQKEPMETVHCTLLETGETQAAQQSLVQRARSVLFGTCVVQNCEKNIPEQSLGCKTCCCTQKVCTAHVLAIEDCAIH